MTPPAFLTDAEMSSTPHDIEPSVDGPNSRKVVRATGATYKPMLGGWWCVAFVARFDREVEIRFDFPASDVLPL